MFPLGERFIPPGGTFYSPWGNVSFPLGERWPCPIPTWNLLHTDILAGMLADGRRPFRNIRGKTKKWQDLTLEMLKCLILSSFCLLIVL